MTQRFTSNKNKRQNPLKREKLGAQTTIGGKQFHGGMALTANDDKLAADLQTG